MSTEFDAEMQDALMADAEKLRALGADVDDPSFPPTPPPADALAPALKPCPFCGNAELHNAITDRNAELGKAPWYWIVCPDCGATTESGLGTMEDVVANWNRRAPAVPASSALAPERIAEIRARLDALAYREWYVDGTCAGDTAVRFVDEDEDHDDSNPGCIVAVATADTDAEFIAHSPADIADLLADRERFERRVGELTRDRKATDADVEAVEEHVGVGSGAWDMEKPERIIEAAWAVLRATPDAHQ